MKNLKTKIIIGVSAFFIATMPILANSALAGDPRDCDSNAVVRCGAFSKTELINKINSSSELKTVFFSQNRNITQSGIQNSVNGVVTKNGTVIVSGRTVASGVFSSGRSFMPGSTKDGSLWMRPPSVSFNSSSLDAFVIMDRGVFKSAIIKSCGNPVKVLAAPFPQVFKRVQNENTGIESDADTVDRAIKAKEGDKLLFTVTTTNQGTAAAQSVTINDTLPTGLNLLDPSKRVITSNIGSVSAASRKSITIRVTVAGGTAGKCLENVAVMTAQGGFKDKDSAFVCVEKAQVQQEEENIKIIKFEDIDHDGIQDQNEGRLSGFKFRLDNGTTKVTDSNGIVVFNNVSSGSHKIEEVDIPSGFIAIHKNPFNITVPSGQTVTELFGNQKVVRPVVVPPQPPVQPPLPIEKVEEVQEEEAAAPAPAALPEAGPEAVAGGILGALSLGWAGRNYLRSRRNLKETVKHSEW